MYEAQQAKHTETDGAQTTAPTQMTAHTKQGTQQTADLTRIPPYAQAWGNHVPSWLRPSAPREGSQEGETTLGHSEPLQRKENTTGLPDTLKTGVENLSGLSIDDVQVHYNSSKPAQVHALAYTQGTEIHVGPGQEQHLAHEAWHAVQQKQGRVKPTLQAKGEAINDDEGLEREADMMGGRAPTAHSIHYHTAQLDGRQMEAQPTMQRMLIRVNGRPLKDLVYYKVLYQTHKAAIDSLEKQANITVKNENAFRDLINKKEEELGLTREESLKEEESKEEGEESDEDGKGEVNEEEAPLSQPLPSFLKEILKAIDVSEDIKLLNEVLKENLPAEVFKTKVSAQLYKAALFEGNPIETRGITKAEQQQLLYLYLTDKSAIASCYPAATRLLNLVGARDEEGKRKESFNGGGEEDSFDLKNQQQLIKKLCQDLQQAADGDNPIIFKIQLGGKGKEGHGFTLTLQKGAVYQLEALAGQGNNANIMLANIMRGGRRRAFQDVVKALQSIASANPQERKAGADMLGWNANMIGLITEDETAIIDPMNVYWTASVLASEGNIQERVAEQISTTQKNILAIVSERKPEKRRKLIRE